MSDSKRDLLARLRAVGSAQGITPQEEGDSGIRGQKEAIKAKWFLGGNKSVYTFSCRLDEATHTVNFRESILEKSWGIAPPSFKVQTYSQSGTTVTSSERQKSVGGGGVQEMGPMREACARAVIQAGWQFKHEPMRVP